MVLEMNTTSGEDKRPTAGSMNWNKKKTLAVILAIVALVFAGRWLKNSGGDGQQVQTQSVPIVVTHQAQRSDLSAEREYVGRVDPIQSVSLRPQVSGEIARVHFQEGSKVNAGQLLFTIDDTLFRAAVEARKADLAQAEANYDRASKYFARLKASDPRSVSASVLDTAESDVLQGRAAVAQAKAALTTAQINLGYTRITAPISGQISKAAFTKGNYVTPAAELTSIVQTAPIRITFTLPDKDFMGQLDQFRASRSDIFNAAVRLASGEVYNERGARDFEDNQIDPSTGTIRVSMRYNNKDGLLIPGSMVRITVKPVLTRVAVVIPQESIMADSQGDYIYIVDSGDVARQRRVKLGINYGVMREVVSGVEPGEMVVAKGTQAVREGVTVKQVPARAEGETSSAADRAMESGFDLKPVSEDGAADSKTESGEGKN